MKEKYARLLLIKCLGLENKRPLFIQGNEHTREFIEIVKKEANKTTLWFALGLYLDFINLLLLILRIFGNNK